MAQKRMPWDRPPGSSLSNRQGDDFEEPIFTELGRALSAWEGTNAAINSLHQSLQIHLGQIEREAATSSFELLQKTHDRAQSVRQLAACFLAADFGDRRDDAARIKKKLNSALSSYVGWATRRNELAHGYVTSAQCPDYRLSDQPVVTVYALLPSHARTDRWCHAEPEWNYLAAEIREFAFRFSLLDEALEALAWKVAELSKFRTAVQ
jgi:hypothetical protein